MKTITFNKGVSFLLAFFFLFILSASAQQQTQNSNSTKKKKKTEKKEEQVKKGWNLGALPVISFDSDLGFQYGALMNLYNYGNGKDYPNYRQSLYMEVSQFTKKSGIYRVNYNTKDLVKGMRVYFDLSYMPDQAYNFYGFNGYDAFYNASLITDGDPAYLTRVYYKYQRKFFRFKIDVQGNFKSNKKFHWDAGIGLYNMKVAPADITLLNKGKTNNLLPDVPGLYQKYIDWNIIPQSEKNGGTFTVFKAGLEYDSRDNEANPNKGVWTEVVLAAAPRFASNMADGFMKLSITHREYFTLIKNKLLFDYRVGAQINLSGHTPFYALPLIFYARSTSAYNEGLGGSGTLRGILRNRVIGDGVLYGNFEIRWRAYSFRFINQNFYMGLVGFFDSGTVIQKVKFSLPSSPSWNSYLPNKSDGLHNSLGLGFIIAMNENFIISVNHGQAMNAQDGTSGTYVGLNYMF